MFKIQNEVGASPSDTTIPGLAQRRVWKSPEVTSHSIVVLTLPRLYLTPMTGTPKTEVIGQLQTVRRVDAFLGPLATAIDLHTVRRVKLELATFTVTIDYVTPHDPKARTIIRFASGEIADAFFAKLWRRLGDGFKLKSHSPEWWTLARIPLIFIASVILFTALCAIGLNLFTDLGHQKEGVARILPNWRVACIFGGGVVAAAQVWLYRSSSIPPDRLELVQN